MPTILNINGFRFFFYSSEHEPKHIHVVKAGNKATFLLSDASVRETFMSAKDTKQAQEIVFQHKILFTKAWNSYFNI